MAKYFYVNNHNKKIPIVLLFRMNLTVACWDSSRNIAVVETIKVCIEKCF